MKAESTYWLLPEDTEASRAAHAYFERLSAWRGRVRAFLDTIGAAEMYSSGGVEFPTGKPLPAGWFVPKARNPMGLAYPKGRGDEGRAVRRQLAALGTRPDRRELDGPFQMSICFVPSRDGSLRGLQFGLHRIGEEWWISVPAEADSEHGESRSGKAAKMDPSKCGAKRMPTSMFYQAREAWEASLAGGGS